MILRVVIGVLMLQALVKFAVFFLVSYATRRRMLDSQYGTKNSATNVSDILLLTIVIVLVTLLFASGRTVRELCRRPIKPMTLIQTSFHEFSKHRPRQVPHPERFRQSR